MRPQAEGGYGLDALWNDDLHHSAMVALTGRAEAYYEDHAGAPQEFIAAAKHGYLFQGQVYAHQGQRRGTPGLDLPPAALVAFLQNHDQVANSGTGQRFHELSHPGMARALTAYTLLIPATPMLFQGQEFWSSSPFLYFCDHGGDLAGQVRTGRTEFLTQFPSVGADAALRAGLADPSDPRTFARSKLDWSELASRGPILALHRDLLALRRGDPTVSRQRPGGLDGTVIGRSAFALRLFGDGGADRLIVTNLGPDLLRRSIPDPLVAPPAGCRWSLLWSSENPAYSGQGTPEVETDGGWRIPGYATVVLSASTPSLTQD